MNLKKPLAGLIAAALTLSLTACASGNSSSQPSSSDTAVRSTVRLATLKGPAGMGMVKLLEENEQATSANDYVVTLAGTPDEFVGKIVQGEVDIAAVPLNLAATLYNKTGGKVQVLAVTTLGAFSLVENGNTIESLADLKGKTIYATGQGSTPEYVLNYVLRQNGLEPGVDVKIEYRTEHAEVAALLAADQASIALLPQPFVTSAMMKNDKLREALNWNTQWEALTGMGMPMGCVLVQKEFAQSSPEVVAAFLNEYKASIDYVTQPANLDATAALIEQYDILAAPVAKKALPACNIVFLSGADMTTPVEGFLKVLFEAEPNSVGGALPASDFYYGA